MHNNLTQWKFSSLPEIRSKIPYVIYSKTIHPDWKSQKKKKKKKIACTAEPLYIRKTVLWAAELMRPGFLWVVSNGQIPRCLKRCKLLFSHIEVLTLQYGFAFNISLPKALGRGRTGKAQQQSRFPVSSCLFSGYWQDSSMRVALGTIWPTKITSGRSEMIDRQRDIT